MKKKYIFLLLILSCKIIQSSHQLVTSHGIAQENYAQIIQSLHTIAPRPGEFPDHKTAEFRAQKIMPKITQILAGETLNSDALFNLLAVAFNLNCPNYVLIRLEQSCKNTFTKELYQITWEQRPR